MEGGTWHNEAVKSNRKFSMQEPEIGRNTGEDSSLGNLSNLEVRCRLGRQIEEGALKSIIEQASMSYKSQFASGN